jgi:hypothetical protein
MVAWVISSWAHKSQTQGVLIQTDLVLLYRSGMSVNVRLFHLESTEVLTQQTEGLRSYLAFAGEEHALKTKKIRELTDYLRKVAAEQATLLISFSSSISIYSVFLRWKCHVSYHFLTMKGDWAQLEVVYSA